MYVTCASEERNKNQVAERELRQGIRYSDVKHVLRNDATRMDKMTDEPRRYV